MPTPPETERARIARYFARNSKALRCDLVEPPQRVVVMLAEVEREPTAIFWG